MASVAVLCEGGYFFWAEAARPHRPLSCGGHDPCIRETGVKCMSLAKWQEFVYERHEQYDR